MIVFLSAAGGFILGALLYHVARTWLRCREEKLQHEIGVLREQVSMLRGMLRSKSEEEATGIQGIDTCAMMEQLTTYGRARAKRITKHQ